MVQHDRDVRSTPKSGHCRATVRCPLCAISCREQVQQNPLSKASLFDHLVGEQLHRNRHFEAQRLRCLEVDHELELGRLHNRKIRGFLAFENTARINACLVVRLSKTGRITDEPTGDGIWTLPVDRRYSIMSRQRDNLIATCVEKWIDTRNNGAAFTANDRVVAPAAEGKRRSQAEGETVGPVTRRERISALPFHPFYLFWDL